jgi:hypothetical protein
MEKDQATEFHKNYTRGKMLEYGKNHAKSSSVESFRTYVTTFTPEQYQDN